MFKPKDWLDRLFQIGIILKGLDGVMELVGGLLLPFVTPGDIRHLVAILTQGELSEDPDDVVARYLLHTANGLTGNAVIFGAAYLLLHGAVKSRIGHRASAEQTVGVSLHDHYIVDLYRLSAVPNCAESKYRPDCAHRFRCTDRGTDMAGVSPSATGAARSIARHRERCC
jgi:hypothetical protein